MPRITLAPRGLCLAGLAMLAGTAHAQQFQRAIGTTQIEKSFDMKTTFDNGWVNVGMRNNVNNFPSMLVVKHFPIAAAAPGSVQWDGVYQTDGRAIAYSVVQPTDSTYVVAGESDIFGTNNLGISLTRLDPAGNILWAYLYRGTPFADAAGTAVTKSKDGYLVVGRYIVNTGAAVRGVLLKTLPDGTPIFERSYAGIGVTGAPVPLTFSDVRELPDRSVIVVGTITDAGQTDTFVMRTDAAGNVIQARAYGLPNVNETGDGVDYDNGSRIVISGRTNEFGPAVEGTVVLTLDAFALAPIWNEAIKDFTNGYAAVNFAPDSTISIAGSINASVVAVVRDAKMIRLTPAGGPIWGWRYGSPTTDEVFETGIPTPWGGGPNGYAAAGSTTMAGFGSQDLYFTQADTFGVTNCLETRSDPAIRPKDIVTRTLNVPVADILARVNFPLNRVLAADKDDVLCFTPPCPCVADYDGSGGTPDASDIDAFFADWLAGLPGADADCSGGTPDASDIDTFFAQWLAGGC